MVFTHGDLKMAGSTLRNSTLVCSLVIGTAVTACASEDSANAAQPGGVVAVQSGPCWHVGVSDWTCPDSQMVASRPDYVTGVSITVQTRDGKSQTVRLPAGVDAIFLTKEATEKFLLSYYWATNKEKAEAVQRKLGTLRDAAR